MMANWIFKPRRTMSAFTNRAEGKAARLTVNANLPFQGSLSKCFSPLQVKMCKRQLFIRFTWTSTMSLAYFFFFFQTVKESAWASSLSNCIKLRPPSPFNSKAEQLVAFIFNPGDITFHHIPLGPPNPL